jgi:hypothetical protein
MLYPEEPVALFPVSVEAAGALWVAPEGLWW